MKKAVQQVIKEEDCSRNFLIFGLAEESKEDTPEVVNGVLECTGIKTKKEAVRIGLRDKATSNEPKKPRPIKISVGSSAQVFKILRMARNLKDSDLYTRVFLAPERFLICGGTQNSPRSRRKFEKKKTG